MGNFRIEIEGVGAHHNDSPTDANEVAALLAKLLRKNAKISSARFLVVHPDGEVVSSEDLLAEEPGAEADIEQAAPEHIAQFFAWDHLPAHLATVSAFFGYLAEVITRTLPRNPERTVALRKLLESKDAAVRARVAK